jgi:hypothetical protein
MMPGCHRMLDGRYINYGYERDSIKHYDLMEMDVHNLSQYMGHNIGNIIIINYVPNEAQTTKLQIYLQLALTGT